MHTNNFGGFGPFTSPFSTPFGGQFASPIAGQFGTPFGSPIASQFGNQFTPFGGTGFGQPTWGQGYGLPFGGQFQSPISSQFGSPVTQFGLGAFGPISSMSFGGISPFTAQSDWSMTGGRFGPFASQFSTPFPTPVDGSCFGQGLGQFGATPFGTASFGTGPFGFQGVGGFSPVGYGGGTPFGGVWSQPIAGGFSPIGSFQGQSGSTGFASVNGSGRSIPGSTNGQGVSGFTSGGSVNPITGSASTSSADAGVFNPTLNQCQQGFSPVGTYGTIPTQLVAGQFGGPFGGQPGNQFGGQFVGQGWNGPITGSTPNQFTGQPIGFGSQLVTGGYGQPIFQTSFPTGFQAQGSHGNPSELRSAAGTTINVSQRDAA
ncbi:MAG: hypothetical protein ACIAS6_15370 [Phycisphaerales bacterium JB060]